MSEGERGAGARVGKRSWHDSCSSGGRSGGARRRTTGGYREREPQRTADGRRAQDKRFQVPRADDLARLEQRCSLSKPMEIGHYSKYGNDEVRFDRSNLLRYKEPEIGLNLLYGIENYVSKEERDPEAHPAPIAPILAALAHFQGEQQTDKSPHFVTFRNNLNKIMGTPYNTSNEWTFFAEKCDGCVYLDVRRTQSDIDGSRSVHENQKRGMYAGRQFEIFSTLAKSSEVPSDGDRAVNENEEYCGLFSTTLSGKRLVIAAEIDCYTDDGTGAAAEDKYVELKTFRVLQREKDTFVFERFKLLAFWIQSFVVGIPKIVCGFRNDDFEICKLQSFKTTDIPSFCRKYWSPNACLNFTSSFLDWLYAEAEEGKVYQVTYFPREHSIAMVDLISTSSFLPATSAGGLAPPAKQKPVYKSNESFYPLCEVSATAPDILLPLPRSEKYIPALYAVVSAYSAFLRHFPLPSLSSRPLKRSCHDPAFSERHFRIFRVASKSPTSLLSSLRKIPSSTMNAWKFAATMALAAFCHAEALSFKDASSSDSTDRPGICKDTPECSTGYECVALQTTRDATVAVKQCLPKAKESDVCAGQLAGLCPTFSSWKAPYNAISSVCTYKPADNCAKNATGSSVKGELMCVTGAKDASGNDIDVIYGCTDFDPKKNKLLFGDSDAASKLAKTLNTADAVTETCLDTNSNSTSGLLCSGQGTCLTTGIGLLKYMCKCNVGYAGDFCEIVNSNECALPGQCATGVCNLTTKLCECAAGTTGPQCSECDATSTSSCNGKGKCDGKTCTCDDGWEGLQCTKQVKKTVKTKTNSTSSNDTIANSANTSVPTSEAAKPFLALALTVSSILLVALVN